MKKTQHQDGFGAIEALLILVVVLLVGFIAWRAIFQTGENNSATRSDKDTVAAVNPYEGWKNYCIDDANVCFKYPADWKNAQYSGSDVVGAFVNPANTLKAVVAPLNNTSDLTIPSSYHTLSLDKLYKDQSAQKVWGGYSEGELNVPQYQVIDASLIGVDGLDVGKSKSTKDANYPYFTTSKNTRYTVNVFDANQGEGISQATAEQWFKSADAKLALKVAQSTYFK